MNSFESQFTYVMDIAKLYLAQIPASFWGVVFGSFFSILAVWLSNRASEKRLNAQFLHEQTIKAKERELNLKKDIYLPVSEAISAGISTLTRLSDLDLPHRDVFTQYHEKSPVLARVHVVGKMETIQGMADLTGELNSEVLRLRITRDQLLKERRALQVDVDSMNKLGNKRDELFEELLKYRIEQPLNTQAHKMLEDRLEFETNRTNKLVERVKDREKAIRPKHEKFIQECVDASLKIGPSLATVLSAIRKELELPFDAALYRQIADRNRVRQAEALKSYHESSTNSQAAVVDSNLR